MLKKALIITIAMISIAGFQSQAIAEPVAPSQAAITVDEAAALEALQAALAAATTPEQKSQILADAIAATPTLATKPQLSSVVLASATSAGMSVDQVDTAVISGLAQAAAPAAGGFSSSPQIVKNTSTGGGSSTSTATASQASNGV